MALSFNGGKDGTVLLDLVARVYPRFHSPSNGDKKLTMLYVADEDPFPEVTEFIKTCEKR